MMGLYHNDRLLPFYWGLPPSQTFRFFVPIFWEGIRAFQRYKENILEFVYSPWYFHDLQKRIPFNNIHIFNIVRQISKYYI